MKIRTLVKGFMKDVAEKAVTIEVSFNIGDDPVTYTIDLEQDPDPVVADLLAGHLETMGERAAEQGKKDPPPKGFRLTAIVIPATALDDLKGPKNWVKEAGILDVAVAPSEQPLMRDAVVLDSPVLQDEQNVVTQTTIPSEQ